MQRWCKITFNNKEYMDLYPNSDVDLIGDKAAAATPVATNKAVATSSSEVFSWDDAEATTPALQSTSPIPPSAVASSALQKQKHSTADNLKSRQTLRVKYKSITATKVVKVKIKCTSFKPPFIFNETTQRKENMKLVAHILPENVAAEIAMKKSLANAARKQQSSMQQQQQQYDLRAQITMAAQTAQYRNVKTFKSLAAMFKKKMTDLEVQVDSEEVANSITVW
jgi:hypothetical protein